MVAGCRMIDDEGHRSPENAVFADINATALLVTALQQDSPSPRVKILNIY